MFSDWLGKVLSDFHCHVCGICCWRALVHMQISLQLSPYNGHSGAELTGRCRGGCPRGCSGVSEWGGAKAFLEFKICDLGTFWAYKFWVERFWH